MSFSRGPAPFFSSPDTYRLIERVADQRSLVIYAGAGVTIDRTGLSWPALVEKLLKKHKTNIRVREAIMATNTPLRAGSIVSQLYVNRSDDWRAELGNDIRGMLYEGRALAAGDAHDRGGETRCGTGRSRQGVLPRHDELRRVHPVGDAGTR
jgi:hypothetical protein